MAARPPTTPEASSPLNPPPIGPALFPGRTAEVRRVVDLFTGEVEGGGAARLLLVHGAEGVGKSHFLADLRREFVLRGDLVLEGRCTGRRPFDGFAALACRALTYVDEVGLPRPRAAADIEALWNPASAPVAPPAGAPGPRAAEARLRLFDGVRRFLAELSRIRPLVVLLHDIERADEGSVDLLAWLAENLDVDPALAGALDARADDRFRGLVVATVEEGPVHARLRDEALARSPIGSELELRGLDADGVRAFLASPEVVARILASSQGRPDALRDLLDLVPDDVADLSLRRIQGLAGPLRAALEVLAVAARSLPADVVGRLSGAPEALAPLVEGRFVRRTFDGGVARVELLRPGHGPALLAEVPAERLAAVHGALGRWLADAADREGMTADEAAEHLLRSDRPDEAWPLVDEAVRRLVAACAFGRAADLLGRALACAPRTGSDLAERLAALADLHEARGDLDRALLAAGRLKAATPKAERPEVYLRIGRLLTARGDTARALRLLDRAGAGAGALALRLAGARAEARYLQGDLDGAEALCVAALEGKAADVPDPDRMAVRNTLGKVRLGKESPRAAAELFERNRADAVSLGLPREVARALINVGIARLLQDEHDRAATLYEQALAIAEEQGDVVLAAMARGNLAVIAHRRQRFPEALAHYHRCIVELRRVGNHLQLATAVNNLGDLYLVLGDLEHAQRMADFALAAQSAGGSRYGRACNQLLLGDIAAAQRRFARAERCFDVAHEILKDLGGQAAHSLIRLGRIAMLCGRTDRARALADRVAGESGGDATDVRAARGLLRAEIAVEDGRVDGAAAEARFALEAFEELGDREGQWRAHLTLARLRRAEGRAERGRPHLDAASRIVAAVARDLPPAIAATYAAAPARAAVAEELARLRQDLGEVAPPAPSAPPTPEPSAGVPAPARTRHPAIVGRSPRLQRLFDVIDRIAGTDATVLLRGESGTGKELVAEAIHEGSRRANGPFVRVNCAAFVETLLLSELFGHERGAFTGATARRQGRFELADGGTLFLDEIGDMSAKTQVALLRVLQEREFERVGGGGKPVKVDVRVICATNRDLDALVASGEFRIDLLYRLKGVSVELPTLRDRLDDVPLLAAHFLKDARSKGGIKARRFDDATLALLRAHAWPGNVRELENVVRSVALFAEGEVITPADVAMYEELTGGGRIATPAPQPAAAPTAPGAPGDPESAIVDRVLSEGVSLAAMKKRIEMDCILKALAESHGNITRAAAMLQMKRPRLSQIIKACIDLDRLQVKEGVLE